MYLVIACSRCRRSRVVEQGRKTAACGSCTRTLTVADSRIWFSGASLEEARQAAGEVNARLCGREDEYARAFVPAAPVRVRHDSPEMAAAAATRRAVSEKDRADVLARALSAELGEFTEDDLARALALAGLRTPEAHLPRMLATHVLYEPRAGRYQAA